MTTPTDNLEPSKQLLCPCCHQKRERSHFSCEAGRIGGSRQTPAQVKARLANSKLGGWPKGRPKSSPPVKNRRDFFKNLGLGMAALGWGQVLLPRARDAYHWRKQKLRAPIMCVPNPEWVTAPYELVFCTYGNVILRPNAPFNAGRPLPLRFKTPPPPGREGELAIPPYLLV